MTKLVLRATAATAVFASLTIGGFAVAQGQQAIKIVGSSTVYPFSTAVAERFAQTSGFPAPVVESTGTGGGFEQFCAGVGLDTPSITNASRAIKSSEKDTCRNNGVTDVTEIKIGFDGIVLARAAGGRNVSLSRAQLFQALAAEVPNAQGQLVANPYKNWSEIDPTLPNQPITIFGPPTTSGTRDAFNELVMDVGCKTFPSIAALPADRQRAVCRTYRTDGVFVEAGEQDNVIVQRLQQDANAYGIFGWSFLEENQATLVGAPVEGVQPSYDTILNGTYPVSRPLYFYVKNAHRGTVPGITEYVAEFTSEEAFGPEGYLAERGLVAEPEEQRAAAREAGANATSISF